MPDSITKLALVEISSSAESEVSKPKLIKCWLPVSHLVVACKWEKKTQTKCILKPNESGMKLGQNAAREKFRCVF